jgi:hypothetical protein
VDSQFNQVVVTGRDAATATYFPEYETSLRLSFLWTLTRRPESLTCPPISSVSSPRSP